MERRGNFRVMLTHRPRLELGFLLSTILGLFGGRPNEHPEERCSDCDRVFLEQAPEQLRATDGSRLSKNKRDKPPNWTEW